MLASVLLGKLTSDLHLIVSRKISNAELTLDTLQWVMEEELTSREGTAAPRERVANAGQIQQHHRSELPPHATAVTLLYGTHTGPTCSYCQQSHASSECATITEVQAQKEILKSEWTLFQLPMSQPHRRKCKS